MKIAIVEVGSSHSPSSFITLLEEQTVQFLGTLSHSRQFSEQNFMQVSCLNYKQECKLDEIVEREGEGGAMGLGVGSGGDNVLFVGELVVFDVLVIFDVSVEFVVFVVSVVFVKFVEPVELIDVLEVLVFVFVEFVAFVELSVGVR